ncbi:MAG: NUDIX domain-containing protein [Oscillospiraceae bacterium]|nr:NUDIX domain-containing protein [Oscillospiraceae bacterium]
MPRIIETVTFTNMIMIEDGKGNVVVENRKDPEWHGLVFPGGHVEHQEAFFDSVVREAYEETGLTISEPKLVGMQHFAQTDGYRYVAFFFRTSNFTGELKGSDEGEVFWMPPTDLLARENEMCPGFEKIIRVFLEEDISEYVLIQSKTDPDDWTEQMK